MEDVTFFKRDKNWGAIVEALSDDGSYLVHHEGIRTRVMRAIKEGEMYREGQCIKEVVDIELKEEEMGESEEEKRLKEIKEWRMNRRGLKGLPEEVFKMVNLKVLNANGKKIKSISENISKLTSLTELWLSNNQLQ